MKSRPKEASSMGANNNSDNNNSYNGALDGDLNELRRHRQVSWLDVGAERVAASESRLLGADRILADQDEEDKLTLTANTGTDMVRGYNRKGMNISSTEGSNHINQKQSATGAAFQQHQSHHQSKISLFVTILLPLVLVFLLPSPIEHDERIGDHLEADKQDANDGQYRYRYKGAHQLDQLLLSLLRLPLDRFRLSSGYSMMLLANAKEIQPKHSPRPPIGALRQVSANDLQEEETSMLLVAPDQPVHQRPSNGYQLAPVRQAPATYGGSLDQEPATYGHDYAAGGNSANLINEATGNNDEPVAEAMPASASGSVVSPSGGSQIGSTQNRPDLPSVRALNVKCEKNHMTVNIVFDRPFYGMVFSKGHYNDQKCVHLPPNSGQTSINFDIHLGKCGMSSSSDSLAATNSQQQTALQVNNGQQQQPNGLFIENTIIIQYDPQVQEIYDQARRLRCTWYDYYEKSVTFRPYNVDMLDAVTANFLGDNIQCWMQIQVGKGPWSSEVAGIVKIGQTMTMVLAIKDDENKFDMLVRNCVASDGKHQPIQLVDEYGCVARPKIMAKFQKVKNFGPAATVVSYAHFQAFKFPDSMSVHFQCVIQVCRHECPQPVCSAASGGSADQSIGGPEQAGPAPMGGSQDYAASGTELVSSKEPLPGAQPISIVRGQQQNNLSHLLHQPHQGGINSVNLKLDESQGRLQVKLDTSMMTNAAASGGGLRPNGGPLPPHLLQSSQQQDGGGGRAPSGHTYLSSSYYRPSVGSATGSGSSSMSHRALGSSTSASHLATLPVGQSQHHSNPAAVSSLLHHQPRPAYMMTNRMGELVAEDGPIGSGQAAISSSAYNEEESDITKLSLIASPRALPYAMPTSGYNHRYRRSINATANHHQQAGDTLKARRQLLPAAGNEQQPQSTAIKTQRTIQVVSPDDMAFSLIDLDQGSWSRNGELATKRAKIQHYQSNVDDSTMVCFSAGRLITGALASLALLIALILTAVWIIMRQRKRLDEKLSPVYDSSASSSSSLTSPDLVINNQSLMNHQHQHQHQHHHHQQQQQQQRQRAEQIILRRQQEEMQQRDTYLSRLYSQFVPAAYWS